MLPTPKETNIKVLAFDQGGIYIGVDYWKTIRAFEKLGATNATEVYTQADQTHIVDNFERGKISIDDFYKYLRAKLKGLRSDTSDNDLFQAWNAILTGVIPGVLEFIKSLRQLGYITVVVSNTDAIHQQGVEKQIATAGAQDLFREAFCQKYLSYIFGMNKPYVETFNAITKDLQLTFPNKDIKSHEILFIDDSEKHLVGRDMDEGATKAGWQTLLAPSNLPIKDFSTHLIQWLKDNKQ